MLPQDLLKSSQTKLNAILIHLSKQLYNNQNLEEGVQVQQIDTSEVKKSSEQNQNKKKSLLAKMKAKQQSFLNKSVAPEESKDIEMVQAQDQQQFTCSSCSQEIDLTKFNERPIAQMGNIHKHKLLYRCYKQTHEQRLKAFENMATTHGAQIISLVDDEKLMHELDLKSLMKYEQKMSEVFMINDVLDPETMCGVQLNRCCHYFHQDCLEKYLTTDQSHEKQYVRRMVGMDDGEINCPLCKRVSNTFMPLYPATLDTQNLVPYVDFMSMLINSTQREYKALLYVDIKQNVEGFMDSIHQFFMHQMLVLASYRQDVMFKKYDPHSQSNSMTLRDLVFILRSSIAIAKQAQGSTKEEGDTLENLVESIQQCIIFSNENSNLITQNYSKLLIQVTLQLILAESGEKAFNGVVNQFYQLIRKQACIANYFQQNYKPFPSDLKSIDINKIIKDTDLSTVVQLQLHFLRIAACMKLIFKAVKLDVLDLDQLGLDTQFMQRISEQVSDKDEFDLLFNYLELTQSEENLLAPMIEEGNVVIEGIAQVLNLNADLQKEFEFLMKGKENGQPWVPDQLLLLVPNQTLSMPETPPDYQTLVKTFYCKQCRNCRKQIQQNAMCLQCGEIVCLSNMQKTPCCQNLPNQRSIHFNHLELTQSKEGELSYHARESEGGCAAFLVPATSEVIIVHNGRSARFDSFYRNEVGECFKQDRSNKWENYFCTPETGGSKIQQRLKKALIQGELPEYIMQERNKAERVIIRYIY